MILVGNSIVSDDIKDVKFSCNLSVCKGECCVQGDAGAPLLDNEVEIINNFLSDILPYLSDKSIKEIEKHGFYEYDISGELCTRIISNRECVFQVLEDGISYCGIEKAYREGKIDFLKPISCDLYPIRVLDYGDFSALNYHKWDICSSALEKGKKLSIPLYEFLKEPLIRRFGDKWYKELLSEIDHE